MSDLNSKVMTADKLGVFIRSIIGLDIIAAQNAFSDFIQAGSLRED